MAVSSKIMRISNNVHADDWCCCFSGDIVTVTM